MPTYDYRCPAGHEFEQFFRKIKDAPSELPCPTCGKLAERRVSGGAGLLFKGSGFYITDYGKDGKKRPAAPGAEKKAGTESGGSGSEGGGGEGQKADAPASTPAEKPAAKKPKGSGPEE